MNDLIHTTYHAQHLPIPIQLKKGVASIDVTAYQSAIDLKHIYQHRYALVSRIKNDYQNAFGQNIQISDRSFLTEIWGHLVVYRMAIWAKRYIRLPLFNKLTRFVAYRSGTIDCGEKAVDSNRWFWDVLAKLSR